MLSLKPLRSTGITLLLRYYGLLRPPLRPVQPLCIPLGLFLLAGLPGSSVVLSTHAVPFHPGEPDDCLLSFLRHQYWFRHIRQGVHSHWFNEAVSGSLALRLASLSNEASPGRITPPYARLTTYVTSNSYDELLSAHENNQACPGAPDKRMWRLLILLPSIRLSVFPSVDHCALSHNDYRGRLAEELPSVIKL